MSSSIYSSAFPNAFLASDWQREYASFKSLRSVTTRVPLPPPPASALIITAALFPNDLKKSSHSFSVLDLFVPSTTGTPALVAACLAFALSPNNSSKFSFGPINVMLWLKHSDASLLFSARKPYPGWSASQLVSFAIDIIFSISK